MAVNREEAVAWVLDFIAMDLERMKEADLLKTVIDLREHLFQTHGRPVSKLPEGLKPLQATQAKLKKFFETSVQPALENPSRSPSFGLPTQQYPDPRWLCVCKDGRLHVLPIGQQEMAAVAVERFFWTLALGEPLPSAHFQTCKECKRWFFSSKSKRFCAPRCNWRFNSKKKRGEKGSLEREAYNRRQADFMYETYPEKVATKYGPKVKVQRRVRRSGSP